MLNFACLLLFFVLIIGVKTKVRFYRRNYNRTLYIIAEVSEKNSEIHVLIALCSNNYKIIVQTGSLERL